MRNRFWMYTEIPEKKTQSRDSFLVIFLLIAVLFCMMRWLLQWAMGGEKHA